MGQRFASLLLNKGVVVPYGPCIRLLDNLYVWNRIKYLIINNPILRVDIVLSYLNPSDALFPQVYTNGPGHEPLPSPDSRMTRE